jgi:hypothetical protein
MIPQKQLTSIKTTKPPKPLKNIRSNMQKQRTTSPIKKPVTNPQLSSYKNPNIPRTFPKMNPVGVAHTTKPSGAYDGTKKPKIYEDGAVAGGMSIGSSSVSPISGPQTDTTASAIGAAYHRKKKLQNIIRRKVP